MQNIGALLGTKKPPLIGLDISTSGVRLVELAEAGKNELRLERYASEPLPRGAVVDGNIENIDQVSEAVRRVWKKSGTRIKNVALGMPPASVITKKIILPNGLSEDQLEVQVESEASQYIPFALDEVSLDFDVIGVAANSPDDVEVMLAASRREKVEDRVAIAEAAGLKAVVMDIESYAARAAIDRITAMMPGSGVGQIVALFQIGAQVTHISVMLDGQTIYEREQPFGGNQLTQDIVRAYGLPFEDRVAIAEAAGLKAVVMDIESYAARAAIDRITAMMPGSGVGQIVALFQIGAQVTHISVMLDGQTIYEREQPFGGNQLTQDIVRAYGLPFEDAESRKKSGDLDPGYENDLLGPFLESAAMEVTRAIQFFFTSTPYTKVDQLFLAGGCAVIPGLLEIVASRTKISTTVVSPFKGMQLSTNVREKQLRQEAPSYLVACGLALRRFG